MTKKIWMYILIGGIALLGIVVAMGYRYYGMIYNSNVQLEQNSDYLLIKTGSAFDDVLKQIEGKKFVLNINSFKWVATRKHYNEKVKPGRYLIKSGMSNNELINKLRSGEQDPIKLTFNNIRYKTELAGLISYKLEADSLSLLNLLNDESIISKSGLTSESSILLCLPNTYEFYWNTSAQKFIDRMIIEYEKFWNKERLQKVQESGLTRVQVGVLASIVQSETNKADEMQRVAGVYINRIHKGILLQADPTLIYAIGDFTIKRVLNIHKEVDSPYNTYKYLGLPPGPICMPNTKTIDMVLNYEKHDYIYFCAKEDLSGHHNFSNTIAQHLVYARQYQQALNKLNILK